MFLRQRQAEAKNDRVQGRQLGQCQTSSLYRCGPPSYPEHCNDHTIAGEETSLTRGSVYDPNDCEEAALAEWLPRMDIATWPHVLRYCMRV